MPRLPATKSGDSKTAVSPLPESKGEAVAFAQAKNTAASASAALKNKSPDCQAAINQPPSNQAATGEALSNQATTGEAPNNESATDEALSDETLMEALCRGDDSALAPLMQRWELPVKGFLLRLGVGAADVEDIAQEAFVRLYFKRSAWRSGSAFKPWLLTLAANLGRNRLRWRLRRRENSIDALCATVDGGQGRADATHILATNTALPSDLAERKQRRETVRSIIDALPVKLRSAVVCVDLEGLSHSEAASVLGCTAKAVENRLHRARERIRNQCAHWLARGEL